MAFSTELAEAYETRLAEVDGVEHVRFEHRADTVRSLPAGIGFVHVGTRQYQGEGIFEDYGVKVGSLIAVTGVVAALVSACSKIVSSH